MVVLCVVPKPNTESSGATWPASGTAGYYMTVGLRVAPERVKALLESLVTEGVIRWDETQLDRVNPDDLDQSILSKAEPIDTEGVWYRSGRVFFSEW